MWQNSTSTRGNMDDKHTIQYPEGNRPNLPRYLSLPSRLPTKVTLNGATDTLLHGPHISNGLPGSGDRLPVIPDAGYPGGPEKRKERKKLSLRTKFILIMMLVLVLGPGIWATIFAYQTLSTDYHADMAQAQAGIQHLHTASTQLQTLQKNAFNSVAVAQAQREFVAAESSFTQVEANLSSLPSVSTLVPVYGGKLGSALRLLPLAIEVSQAGEVGCSILSMLISRFRDPLNTKGGGLSAADMVTLTANVRQILTIAGMAVAQANALQPGDLQLDPRLASAFATFQKYLPSIQQWMNDAGSLLTVLPSLLGIGKPANYLIEMVDASELRPAGGFIGNYGIASIAGGRFTGAHITDVYLLDWPFLAANKRIAYPPQYSWFSRYLASNSWSFRDSNLDADFPTVARNGEANYIREGGNVPVQGVISITPALIQKMLAITGPIFVPKYQETVTAQNLVTLIHYFQLGAGRQGNDVPSPDGNSSVRKNFTALLEEQFVARIHQLSSAQMVKVLQVIWSSLRTKDIQVYFNSGAAEALLRQNHLDASLQSPAGDGLFMVDANVSPDKANSLITDTLNDQVVLDSNGDAIHHTTLSYAWLTNGNVYGSLVYRDYLRVYLPPNSKVSVQDGWEPYGTSTAFGREVLAGYYTLVYGQTRTITLVWMVPHAATHDAQGWHYHNEIQRQAGAQWTIHVQIMLPANATSMKVSGGLIAHGKTEAVLNQPLLQNVIMGVDYT
ncbi:MAG TPA: DUF4012 domain-containing protein [Ktedonobacteraceae bacterium]|nr:DUF4012 domain-containing protein [Ktedonobacteraceae bacterium]